MTVFLHKDYKQFMASKVEENLSVRGYQSKMAKAAGCQRSYLSQVLNSHVHLTPDHAAGLCFFWGMSADETDFFLLLVNLARASSPQLKRILKLKIAELVKHRKNTGHYLDSRKAPCIEDGIYYSAWYWAAIHMILGVPEYRRPSAIAERLRLPLELVNQVLSVLERMKFVRRQDHDWLIVEDNLHLGPESFFSQINHINWRNMAIARIQEIGHEGVHYTGVHTLSVEDAERVYEMMRQFVAQTRQVVGPSPSEDMMCLTIDFFRI